MEYLVALEGIEKTYRPGLFQKRVRALDGLTLRVERGECYGFLGVNGAGKTTTFKVLLGLLRTDAGRGELLGAPLGNRTVRRRLGFLPELPAYYPHLTGAEVLRFARDLSGVPRDDAADRRLFEELGIGVAADRRVRRLSKGQLQRVGLAQCLVHEPELLILDEPMSGLDPIARGLVKDRLRRERAAGRTLLLSTHVLADVENLVDRVGLLASGKLALEERADALLASNTREVVITGEGAVSEEVVADIPGASWRAGTAGWTVSLEHPAPLQVDACVRRLVRAGATIHGLETRRDDLETIFIDRIRREEQA
ncbi:MAG: ABC transporter ATP-binding protein [Candidatus Eisenbacteria bacterium]|uniref:ABC transporter ATP-binding protein n=1 Tax=Eiseniibacteriota bacterium TaxID=2212470 RepID=A0A956RN47_UNCEI|nr:ABC transporter ATP-binding protein [Candidatus Eisenbacteria bacterium]